MTDVLHTQRPWPRLSGALVALAVVCAMPHAAAIEKEVSLVTKEPIGALAVAGRLSIDLHADFMASRTYGSETVLNWYNCGYSGGGGEDGLVTKVGGTFGDFGFQVPWQERDEKYPHAARVDDVPAIRFDGGDTMTANFPIEPSMLESGDMAIEVWFRTVKPSQGDVILGWQSPDGTQTSAPLTIPKSCTGSPAWRHLVVNRAAEKVTWYLDGEKVSGGAAMAVGAGHRMVLGGAAAATPSFKGDLVAVRLHDQPMTDGEIAHNFKGGPMLGTEMHDWWRTEEDKWWSENSAHFRHAIDKEEMATWTEQEMQEFNERKPEMFRLAELAYRCYSERMALRTSVVSRMADERGDGIKYRTPIQPTDGANVMGFDGHFGWACQYAGFINPHELVHGYDAMTGNMAGNYWEAHANTPQTYLGIYQTIPFHISDCSALFPCNGRNYYHDRLMFEHLAQTPAYGPMFISKMWYDGPTRRTEAPYPWQTFERINPYPDRTLGDEYTRMAMRAVTADFTTFVEAFEGPGNTPLGNDGLVSAVNRYRPALEEQRTNVDRALLRSGRVRLQPLPHEAGWWRVPKEQAPQQLGWNVCALACRPGKVTAELEGYADSIRGADWRAGFVGVTQDGNPVYGDVFGPGKRQSFTVTAAMKEVCLVVCATPSKILDIPMTGDFRSFPQRQFPYRVRFSGCKPIEPLVPPELSEPGAAHVNGGGFVAATASVSPSAFVGPQARVLGTSQVRDKARIEDFATVLDATVQDEAIVSGHALVYQNSTVCDHAKVRDYAVVGQKTTVSGNARILEHARLVTEKTCGGQVTVKGIAHIYGGNQSGSAMLDGFYAKANDITKGKWFTWSWGLGQNPGEIDEDFGGLYADYDFNQPHDSLALDAFGATWGYLVNGAAIEMQKDRDEGSKYQDDVYSSLHFHDHPGETRVHRLVGYLRAPATGEYTFWISGDDNAEFWIGQSTEDVASTLACLARSVGHLAFADNPNQKSAPVKLVEGNLYPIAVMHQQTTHAQHFAVAWTRPGGDAPEVIPDDVLSTDRTGGTPGLRRRIWHGPLSIDDVVDSADYRPEILPETQYDGAVRLNGQDQWVSLPPDVADMPACTYTAEVKWDGTSDDARIFEFSNDAGDAMGLLPDHKGKLLFAVRKGRRVESVSGPALRKDQWTTVQVTIDGSTATLSIDGAEVGRNESMTLRPDSIGATDCSLGRGRKGGFFGGCISRFQVHARVPEGTLLPVTFLSPWDKHDLAKINRLYQSQRLPPQNVKGLVVTGVRTGVATTPLQPNDVIVQIGDVRLASGRKVAEALESLRGQATVDVTVRRCTTPLNGEPSWSTVKLSTPTMSTTAAPDTASSTEAAEEENKEP